MGLQNHTESEQETRMIQPGQGAKLQIEAKKPERAEPDNCKSKESPGLLTENQEFLEALIDKSPIGIAVYKSNGAPVAVNDSMVKILGGVKEQALAKNFRDIGSWKDSGMLEEAETVLRTGEDASGEKWLITSWGKPVWLEYSMVGFLSKGEQYLLLQVNDITEQKKSEDKIRENEQKLKVMTDSLPVMIFHADRTERLTFVNKTFQRWRGFRKESALGRSIKEVFGDKAHADISEYISEVLSGAPVSFRMNLPGLTDSRQQLECLFTPHIDPEGEVKGFAAIIRDITEAIEAELELKTRQEQLENLVNERTSELSEMNDRLLKEMGDRKSAERILNLQRVQLLSIFDSMDDMVTVIDPRTYEIVYMNKIGKDSMPHDPTGGLCYSHIYGHEQVCENCPNEKLYHSEDKTLRWQLFNDSTGKYQLINDRLIKWPDGREVKLSIATDISELKAIEKALSDRERLYRTVVETAVEGLWIINPNGTSSFHNKRLAWLLGYDETEISGKNFLDFIHHAWKETATTGMKKCAQGLKVKQDLKFVRKDGSEMWAIVSWAPIMEDNDKFSAALAMISDITERKLAEEENRNIAMAMRSLIEAAPMGIGIFIDNRHGFVNPVYAEMFGRTGVEEIINEPVEGFFVEEDRKKVVEKISGHAAGRFSDRNFKAKGLRKDGTTFHVEAWGSVVQYNGEPASLVFLNDVSETKSLRAQLVQAQKMEAVGTLAGGIAHDFNNLLTVAMGYAELILMELEEGDPWKEELQIIAKAAKDGSDLVQRILTFSRKVEPEPKPINMNKELQRIKKLLQRTIPKMIQVKLDLSDDLKIVFADPGQMEQVILNLAVNAKDAMGEEGTLTIKTKNTFLDKEYCKGAIGLNPGSHAHIMIKDTGEGMDEEILDRIFEPFFTTKKRGEGTGLGLAMVFGIIKSHQGHITCESAKGQGTTFHIYLPAHKIEVKEGTEIIGPQDATGNEMILVIDDEESIRKLCSRALSKVGYKVLTAPNGHEGIELFKNHMNEISLVILDLIMPEMSGKKCLEELFNVDPSVKVLVASGYSAEAPVNEVMTIGAKKFLAKPYSRGNLLDAVRKVLDMDQ